MGRHYHGTTVPPSRTSNRLLLVFLVADKTDLFPALLRWFHQLTNSLEVGLEVNLVLGEFPLKGGKLSAEFLLRGKNGAT
jgi:hypothetical protein